jgi:hypothetical protein
MRIKKRPDCLIERLWPFLFLSDGIKINPFLRGVSKSDRVCKNLVVLIGKADKRFGPQFRRRLKGAHGAPYMTDKKIWLILICITP